MTWKMHCQRRRALAGKNERIEREQGCGVIIVARLSGQCRIIAANCDALALLVGMPAKNSRFFNN